MAREAKLEYNFGNIFWTAHGAPSSTESAVEIAAELKSPKPSSEVSAAVTSDACVAARKQVGRFRSYENSAAVDELYRGTGEGWA